MIAFLFDFVAAEVGDTLSVTFEHFIHYVKVVLLSRDLTEITLTDLT